METDHTDPHSTLAIKKARPHQEAGLSVFQYQRSAGVVNRMPCQRNGILLNDLVEVLQDGFSAFLVELAFGVSVIRLDRQAFPQQNSCFGVF